MQNPDKRIEQVILNKYMFEVMPIITNLFQINFLVALHLYLWNMQTYGSNLLKLSD